MCRIKSTFIPHVRGKWKGTYPRTAQYNWQCVSRPGPATIYLPYANIRRCMNKHVVRNPKIPARKLPRKGRSKRCLITRLPMEILLQITEYLVPTSDSYHAFPTKKNRFNSDRITVLHKFCEVTSDGEEQVISAQISEPRKHRTALASTCRVLSEAYYTTMYGNNHFICEVASDAVYPTPVGPQAAVVSWSKNVRNKLTQALWPLTERTIQYVKHLTILGTLQWDQSDSARAALRVQIMRAVKLLESAQNTKSLTIDLRTGRPWCYKTPSPPPETTAAGRLSWNVQGPDDNVLRLRAPINEDTVKLKDLWELLQTLRGFRDVVLSGEISSESAEELSAKMMAPQVVSESAKAAAKPDRSGLKRKRAAQGDRQTRSRQKA